MVQEISQTLECLAYKLVSFKEEIVYLIYRMHKKIGPSTRFFIRNHFISIVLDSLKVKKLLELHGKS